MSNRRVAANREQLWIAALKVDNERIVAAYNLHQGMTKATSYDSLLYNTLGKFAFKSNSFSCNLVQNCNLVRKLIPN